MGVMSNLVKSNTDINDQLIFANALASAKACAKAYLAATLVSTTPELRTFFSTQLTKSILGHSALIELGLTKKWIDPNLKPMESLMMDIEKSNHLFKYEE